MTSDGRSHTYAELLALFKARPRNPAATTFSGLFDRHRTWCQTEAGRLSPEAGALRDGMNQLWKDMTEQDRDHFFELVLKDRLDREVWEAGEHQRPTPGG